MYVKSVGVELEGGWSNKCKDQPIQFDESVKYKTADEDAKWKHYGELAIPKPGLPPGEWQKWVRDHYPNYHNSTCSIHVHVSFKNKDIYERTVSEKFFNFFYEELEKFQDRYHPEHKLFALRIAGKPPHGQKCKEECCIARFCLRKYQPIAQMQLKNKDHGENALRRTGINWCYGILETDGTERKTVEVRILPMFDKVDDAIQALEFVISLFNKWLASTKPLRGRVQGSMRIVGGQPKTTLAA